MPIDLHTEVQKISEAYCVLHGLPVRRKFTDAELEEATKRVGEAMAQQKVLELPLPDFLQNVNVGE